MLVEAHTGHIERLGLVEAGRAAIVRQGLPLVLLLVSVALFNYYTLLKVPTPFVDEGWNANRAWGFLQTGTAFGTMDAGVFDRFQGYWAYFPLLGTGIHALSIGLFGPSLLALRLVSLLFGLTLLVIVYSIGGILYNRRAGLIAAMLLGLTPAFISASHLARHDILTATLGYLAISLYLSGKNHAAPTASTLSGLLAALSLDIHPIGIIFVITVAALHISDRGSLILRDRSFWGFCMGTFVGGAIFAAIHIFPNPSTFSAIASLAFGSARTPPLLSLDLQLWIRSILDTCSLLLESCHILVVPAAAGSLFLFFRYSTSNRRTITISATLILGFIAFVQYKASLYGILLAPAICLIVAALVDRLINDQTTSSVSSTAGAGIAHRILVVTVGATLLITAYATITASLTRDATVDFAAALETLQQQIPPDASVIGPQTYWFGIQDRRYLSWEQLVYYRRYAPGSDLKDAFRALRPDYLIIDRHLDMFVAPYIEQLPEQFRYLHLPKVELEEFLVQRGQLVAQIATSHFGHVRLYRLKLD